MIATMTTNIDADTFNRLSRHALADCQQVATASDRSAEDRRRAVEYIADELRGQVAASCPSCTADADALAYRLLLSVQ